jgi:hypothetical protein
VAAEARAKSEHLEQTTVLERKDIRNNMSDSRYATRTGSQSDATYDALRTSLATPKRKARRGDEREAQIFNCARGAISIVECQKMTP